MSEPNAWQLLIHERYTRFISIHGDLGVDRQSFEAHIRRVVDKHVAHSAPPRDAADFASRLHTDDLGLCLGCVSNSDAAWNRFGMLYKGYLAETFGFALGRAHDGREFAENLLIDLFLPDRSGQSRIASYDGRSSLATWLRVIAMHRIINDRQRKSAGVLPLEGCPEPGDPTALRRVDEAVASRRYSRIIRQCVELALCKITPHERLILLLRYDDGLPLGHIARLCSVHQSTITRQLDRAIARLRDEVIRCLGSECGLDEAAIDECMALAEQSFSTNPSILYLLRHLPEAQLSGSAAECRDHQLQIKAHTR
jgi:RNA polymerase sigma factor (sigma-70 family)